MGKKNKDFILLKDVDHKLQYTNLIGIISGITPIINRKKVVKMEVEICDTTLSSPGFFVIIQLESDILDQFLAVAKSGLIMELLDIKVAKNDGEVKGEVVDEEEIHMYEDDGTNIKWWLGQKKFAISDELKCAIVKLNKWKKINFNGSSKTNLINNSFEIDSSSELRTRRSGISKKTSISSESSPENHDKKNRRYLADKSFEDKEEKSLRKRNKQTVNFEATNNTSTNLSDSQNIDRKLKLAHGKASKSHSLSPNRFQRTRQSTPRRSLTVSGLPTSTKKKNSNSSLELPDDKSQSSSSDSPSTCNAKRPQTFFGSLKESEENSKLLKKTLNYSNRSLRSSSPYSTSSQDSPSSLSKKLKLNEKSSNAKAIEIKKESVTPADDIYIPTKSVRNRCLRSSSPYSTSSQESPSSLSKKLKLNEKSSNAKAIEIKKESVKPADDICIPTKSVQSSSDTKKTTPKYVSSSRESEEKSKPSKKSLNYNNVSLSSTSPNSTSSQDSTSSPPKKLKLNEESSNAKASELQKDSIKTVEEKYISTKFDQNNSSAKKRNSKCASKLSKDEKLGIENTNNQEHQEIDPSKSMGGIKNPSKLSKQGIVVDKGAKTNTHNLDKSPSKQGIDVNKVDKVSTSSLEKKPLKQGIDIVKGDKINTCNLNKSLSKRGIDISKEGKINTRNLDKSLTKQGIDIKKVDSTIDLEERPSKQGIDISKGDKNNTRNLDKSPSKQGIDIKKADKVSTHNLDKSPSKQDIDISKVDKMNTRNVDKNPSKQGLEINRVDKISTRKLDESPSKQSIDINKVDKLSTRNLDKSPSKQEIDINRMDKVNTRNVDKSPLKQGFEISRVVKISNRKLDKSPPNQRIDTNKVDKIITRNLDKNPSKQGIDINKEDKINTRNVDNNLDKLPSPQKSSTHDKLLIDSNKEGNSNKLNRKSKSSKETGGTNLINSLGLITRKVHLIEVESNGDVSFCELEDVDVPEKIDLQCKVLSEFSLFEENIQVIRVQDGTVSKSPTLSIPKGPSWEGILETVVKDPIVKKNMPYIDIVIFDFPLMDYPVVSGQFYKFRNIMAVRLNLKEDPRPGSKPRNELFFCAKGPNTYVKRMTPKQRQEFEKKLNEDNYKKLCPDFDDKFTENDVSNSHLENVVSAPNQQNFVTEKSDNNSEFDLSKKSSQNSETSPTSRKRKLIVSKLNSKDTQFSNNKSSKVVIEKNSLSGTKKQSPKPKTDEKLEPNVGITASSDETVLGETECLIIKELSEIMHEESQLGLSQKYSEDIHLRNTGSEVTFSQFCDGAKEKVANFRTSTQNDCLSDDIVPLSQIEDLAPLDSSKMEPLVYCPSSPTFSENIPLSKYIEPLETCMEPNQCSESILQSCSSEAISKAGAEHLKTIYSDSKKEPKKENTNNPSTNSSILSVEEISSTSCDIEFEVIKVSSNIKTTKNVKENTPQSEKNSSKTHTVVAPKIKPSFEFDDDLEIISEKGNCVKVDIDIDSNSSILSDFSVENNNSSVVCERFQDVSTNCKVGRDQSGKIDYFDGYYPTTDKECKKIPESCFFKSSRNPSAEDIDYICNDENSTLKYFSYSLDRNLPFLTFDIIRQVGNKNYITVAVTIEKISPSLTDSWKEECIKSRCTCCNKMYNAYNAINCKLSENTNSFDALSVGGLIVCPESQCCNQVLENPGFHFSVESKLKDGSPVTALIAGKHAETIFGCKAQEAAKDETALKRVKGILHEIASKIDEKQIVRVNFARENIFNPNSGPLFIQKFHF